MGVGVSMGTGRIYTASDFNNILLIIEQYRGVWKKGNNKRTVCASALESVPADGVDIGVKSP